MKPGDKVMCFDDRPMPGSEPERWTIIKEPPKLFCVYVIEAVNEYCICGIQSTGIELKGIEAFNKYHPKIRGFNADRFVVVDWE